MYGVMTEIEALLSVDAGHTPPGTKAFFLDDGARGFRYGRATAALLLAILAVVLAYHGTGRHGVTLLLLGAALLAVSAMPTLREDNNRDPKRQVLVITDVGVIVRDGSGLRSWRFEDVNSVDAGINDSRPYLNLIDRHGKQHTIQCSAYRRGLRVRQIIAARLLAVRRPTNSVL